MTKFKTIMDAAKFKKAVQELVADPTHTAEFKALSAQFGSKDKETHVGLYVGKPMEPEFNKDKGTYATKVAFNGTIRRSEKNAKKLLLESTGQASQLKELSLECLKAIKLSYTILVLKPGDAEPEPSADELKGAGLSPVRPQEDAPLTKPGAYDVVAYKKFEEKLTNTKRHLQTVKTVPPEVQAKLAQAVALSHKQPTAAQNLVDADKLLDEAVQELQMVEGAKNSPQEVDHRKELDKLADELQALWNRRFFVKGPRPQEPPILRLKREIFDPQFAAMHAAALKAIKEQDVAKAKRAVGTLDGAMGEFNREHPPAKDPIYQALLSVSKLRLRSHANGKEINGWRTALLKALREHKPAEVDKAYKGLQQALKKSAVDPEIVKNWILDQDIRCGAKAEDHAEAYSKALGVTKEEAFQLLNPVLQEMSKNGKPGVAINPKLPNGARPDLTESEKKQLTSYCNDFSWNVNKDLWKGDTSPSRPQMHEQLQRAFGKTRPFEEPVTVYRGLNFDTLPEAERFLKPFKEAAGSNKLIPLRGYNSTGTMGVPDRFVGNVMMIITARQGLDCSDCGHSEEKELLLDHNTPVKVLKVEQAGGQCILHLEQIILSLD